MRLRFCLDFLVNISFDLIRKDQSTYGLCTNLVNDILQQTC